MFGKHFASMYSGSMFGKPALVFAVWGYSIAMMRPDRKTGACFVELNPQLLAATFASTPQEVLEAIETLCAPDPRSRSQVEDGRRLATIEDAKPHDGPMQYRVVNGAKYRSMRDEEERRTYLREAKRKERSVNKDVDGQPVSSGINRSRPVSSQVEAEAEAEANVPISHPSVVRGGSVKGEGPKANPLVAGRRKDLESELHRLVSREATLTDRDPAEVLAEVSSYEGSRRLATNPAAMSDDRLLNSVLDARARVKALEARNAKRR